jgi:sulfite oxidase
MPGRKTSKPSNVTAIETNNRPDEWRIEQGMAGAKLPIIDQTRKLTTFIHPTDPSPPGITDKKTIEAVGDRKKLFAREIKGWKG